MILKAHCICGDDGIEIPIGLIKEMAVVTAYGEKVTGFVMKPGAFDQMAPQQVKKIKEQPSWFMTKFGFSISYDAMTIPGDRLLAILKEKYNLNVRIRKNPIEGP